MLPVAVFAYIMKLRPTLLLTTLLSCTSAFAATETVLPGDAQWASENSGGGSSTITSTAPRSGNGSLELFGDRTRFFGLGNPYDSNSNIGLLSDLASITFDWNIATDSVSLLGPDYTPALRLHLWDGNQRSELIWEGAYNGTYGNTTKGTWYTSGADDNFWQFQTGIGDSLVYDRSIADWQSFYSDTAYIAAVSIGVGSSVGADYHAFADNLTLTFANGQSTTYNFEVRSQAVPDGGATLALVGAGLALAGIARRRMSR